MQKERIATSECLQAVAMAGSRFGGFSLRFREPAGLLLFRGLENYLRTLLKFHLTGGGLDKRVLLTV